MSVRPAQASVLSKRLNIDAYNHAHNAKDPFTRYNLLSNPLSNPLSNRFHNRLYRVYKHSTGCQTRLTTGLIKLSCIQPVVKPIVQPSLTTGWTNSGCSFNTVVQPVVKPVWQPVWQPVVSCKRGLTLLDSADTQRFSDAKISMKFQCFFSKRKCLTRGWKNLQLSTMNPLYHETV